MDEAPRLAALRAGDAAAYERLVREQGPRMLAVARRMVREESEAEDVVQTAFIQAFRAIGGFEGGSKLSTWLHRITVNAALMKLRKQRRRRETSIDDLMPRFADNGRRLSIGPAWEETPEQAVSRDEVRQAVRAGIDRLPDDYRNVILLRDIEQLDTAETAELLQISVAAVKTRLHRARLALREQLDPVIREQA